MSVLAQGLPGFGASLDDNPVGVLIGIAIAVTVLALLSLFWPRR